MKLVTRVVMICWLGTFYNIFSDPESESERYENQIVTIDEFDTQDSQKVIIGFAKSNPVCTYNPENYAESIDDTVYRAFLPNTGIADDIQTSLDLDSNDSGIELLLSGKSIQKFIGHDHIIFVIKK